MHKSDQLAKSVAWFCASMFAAAIAGCGGGQDPILGASVTAVTGAAAGSTSATGTPATPVVPPVVPPVVTPPVVVQNISVVSSAPAPGAVAVCPDASINATFTVPSGTRLDPASINAGTFTVTGQAPASTPVTASAITLDASSGRIATFVPSSSLIAGTTYTATIKGLSVGAKDLAAPANPMLANYTWNFTVGAASGVCQTAISLKSASRYGVFGGSAGMTNKGIQTVITGAAGTTADVGTTATGTSAITGFHDSAPSDIYTESLGANQGSVTGKVFSCTISTTGPTSAAVNPASCTAATSALIDTLAAYNALVALPPGSNPDQGSGSLANLVLAPGVYKAAGGSFRLQGGNLTLDAQGDAGAVFVFQMATTLIVGGPGVAFPQSVILINGAQAKNVFWQVGSAATINAAGGGTMVGTIISQAGVVVSTAGNTTVATLNGRALSLGASVTLVDTQITVPAP